MGGGLPNLARKENNMKAKTKHVTSWRPTKIKKNPKRKK